MGHEKRLLDFEIIQQATLGDENALQKVVAHYNGYIRTLSTRTYIGDDGRGGADKKLDTIYSLQMNHAIIYKRTKSKGITLT